jgi:DNA-binding winged helix-turn-helix (wHTH) protein
MRVRFGDFVLDREARRLSKNDEVRPLERKAYELLDLLVRRRPAAVSKQEIKDALWPDTHVSESHVSSLVGRVRRALRTGPGGPRFLRTVHGFGYAFDGEARQEEPTRSPEPAGAHVAWERDRFPLIQGENVIGRGEEAAVRIDVGGVSRRHARIVAEGGRFTLEDLGSKNGTYLGDRRLEGPAVLEDGDEFRLGRATLLVFSLRRHRPATVTEG